MLRRQITFCYVISGCGNIIINYLIVILENKEKFEVALGRFVRLFGSLNWRTGIICGILKFEELKYSQNM